MAYQLNLGSHVGMNKINDYLIGSVKEAVGYGANAMMFYTGAPQNTVRAATEQLHIQEFTADLSANGISMDNIIVHAPYIINLANCAKQETFDLATSFLAKEISRVVAIGVKTIVLHPGSAVGGSPQEGLDRVIEGLNLVLDGTQPVRIALETMAGKGNEVGINFDQFGYLISKLNHPEHVGVCWDTCHLWDAGYDLVNNLDAVVAEFDVKVGLNKLFCMHVNDSLNNLGAHKDRHANIGYGYLGFAALTRIVYHPAFDGVVKILETPYVCGKAPYAQEIAMIKQKSFSNPFPEMVKKSEEGDHDCQAD